MSSKVIRLEDVKINGVGDATLEKLKQGGVTTINSIAIMTSAELVSHTGLGATTAQKIITQCRDIINPGWTSAEKVLERREETPKLSTGSRELNRILGGGIHSAAINEFIGEFGAGKSQIAFTSAVICAANGDAVIAIDTEGTYNPARFAEIAEKRGLDKQKVLGNIIMTRAYNAEHLLQLMEALPQVVSDYDGKYVILDSIISHFRSEYKGLGSLADRQKDLGTVIHMLTRVAEGFNIPVLVTNQVQTKVGVMFGDPNQGAGGNIMGHGGTYRVFLRKGSIDKSSGNRTVLAAVIDSAELPEEKVRIMLSGAGVVDEDGSFPEQATLEEVLDE